MGGFGDIELDNPASRFVSPIAGSLRCLDGGNQYLVDWTGGKLAHDHPIWFVSANRSGFLGRFSNPQVNRTRSVCVRPGRISDDDGRIVLLLRVRVRAGEDAEQSQLFGWSSVVRSSFCLVFCVQPIGISSCSLSIHQRRLFIRLDTHHHLDAIPTRTNRDARRNSGPDDLYRPVTKISRSFTGYLRRHNCVREIVYG